MDRCALFIDAGYALADGAMAVHGTRRRDSVSWDHAGLLKLLAGLARDRTGLPVLRCYWYETVEGGRTAEHDSLAEMPGLKLRLADTRPGRREGIESQLRRDLVTLAKSGAISDAFIASADEHLAGIVAEVQDLGLRVVVLHIASDGGWTIPASLRQECDDIVEISGVHLRPFVELVRGAEPVAPDEQYADAAFGSRSVTDGPAAMAGAVTHQGLPAAALPAPGAVYPAPVESDYRPGTQSYQGGVGQHEAGQHGVSQHGVSQHGAHVAYHASQGGGASQVGGQHESLLPHLGSADGAASGGTSPHRPAHAGAPAAEDVSGRGQVGLGQADSSPSGYTEGAVPGARATQTGATQTGATQSSGYGQNGMPAPIGLTGQSGVYQGPMPQGGGQPGYQSSQAGYRNGSLPDAASGPAGQSGGQQNGYQSGQQAGFGPVGGYQGGAGSAGYQNGTSFGGVQNGGSQPGSGPIGGLQGSGTQGLGMQGGGLQGSGTQSLGTQGPGMQAGGGQSGPGPAGGMPAGGLPSSGQNAGQRSDVGQNSGGYGRGAQNSGAQAGQAQGAGAPSGAYQLGGYPAAAPANGPGQNGSGQNGMGQNSMGQNSMGQSSSVPISPGQNGMPQSGPAGNGPAQNGTAQTGLAQNGPAQNGLPQSGPAQFGPAQFGPAQFGPAQSGLPQSGLTQSGLPQSGSSQPGLSSGGYPGGPGDPASGGATPGGAIPGAMVTGGYPRGPAQNGMPSGGYLNGSGQNGIYSGSYPVGDQRGQGMPAVGTGFAAAPTSVHQVPYGQQDGGFYPGQQSGSGSDQQPRGALAPGPGQGMTAAYSPQAQYAGQAQAIASVPAVRAPQPVAISLPEAVKAAHAEGYSFGESVGRDAPGLWLEAVIARKPRMPSDLEARLLQGSALPIDSLLHDEVRHSLRRGFWDALESARR